MPVEYLLHKNIDKQKWDDCIVNAINSLLYVHSFYLDSMTDNWDALVLDNYKAVMPLIWRKKWGIKYLYQPSFIPQQGIFFRENIHADTLKLFISMAFTKFKYADITLNYLNMDAYLDDEIVINKRNNFVLSLNETYQNLYKNYRPSFTKSLRRINKFNLNYCVSTDLDGMLALYSSLYLKKIKNVTNKDITGFKNICIHLSATDDLVIRQVFSQDKNLLAAVLLLKNSGRLYNIISCITTEGKKFEANYFLYDSLVKEFSNQQFILDLEGSDIEGVSDFYKKFNPVNEPYLHVKQNKLNGFIQLFKK